MKLIGSLIKLSLLSVAVLIAANTVKVERKTVNEHFLAQLNRFQGTDSARQLQRGLSGWVDQVTTSNSQARKNPPPTTRKMTEHTEGAEASPWERRELEKILRDQEAN